MLMELSCRADDGVLSQRRLVVSMVVNSRDRDLRDDGWIVKLQCMYRLLVIHSVRLKTMTTWGCGCSYGTDDEDNDMVDFFDGGFVIECWS